MKLNGKVALVTGGNSGIGEATARLFAAEGAAVAVASRRNDANEDVRAAIADAGGHALALPCDVTDPSSAMAAVATTVATLGRLDILVNNAGIIYRDKTAVDTTFDEWNQTMAVNATGTFLMSKTAIPLMVDQGGGAIVNNASYFGLVGGYGTAAYSASKGAVVLLTKAMALDHARDGIRINCVCPGSVETPMMRQEMEEMGGEANVRQLFEDKHPLGRISQPHEIAHAILYLASDDAAFVTGAALSIDGGITAG
ncbi:MAG: glucose 1-dehydrogenase [Acidimicrobiia bacterium]|nr:glucose 1-dehydrogenase [Acidimicrobiia bacterium]